MTARQRNVLTRVALELLRARGLGTALCGHPHGLARALALRAERLPGDPRATLARLVEAEAAVARQRERAS